MRKGDLWLAALLLIAFTATLAPRLWPAPQQNGSRATISQGNSPLAAIDLDRAGPLLLIADADGWRVEVLSDEAPSPQLLPESGAAFNLLELEPGRLRVVAASCPDQICVHRGWVQAPGESVICAPNRILILLEAEDADEEIDALVY